MIFPFSFLGSNATINPIRANLVIEFVGDNLASDGSSQPDTSGNGNTATAVSAPTKQANACGGHASIKFTGSQSMSLASAISDSGDMTCYVVQKCGTSGGNMFSLAKGASAGSILTFETGGYLQTYWNGAQIYEATAGVIFRILTGKYSSSTLTEYRNAILAASNPGSVTAGSLDTLGVSNGSFSTGELAYVCVYNVAHDSTTQTIIQDALAKAFNTKNLLFVGDSITYGYGSSSPGFITGPSYPAVAFAAIQGSQTSYQGQNLGITGETLASMRSAGAATVDQYLFGGSRIYLEGGINDVHTGSDAPTTLAAMIGFITDRISAGWKASQIYALTIHTVTNNTFVWSSDPNPTFATINAGIISNAATYGYNVIDVTQDSIIQDASNLTYRQSDGVHFTDAGYLEYGTYVAAHS